MNNHTSRIVLHRVRLLENRVRFLEEKMAPTACASGGAPTENNKKCHRIERKTFQSFHEKALKAIADMGLTTQQIDVLREFGLLAVDNVTGFQEGRSGHARFETLKEAIRYVAETDERAYYIAMDLQNLGGLNTVLGHSGANEIFARIASIIQAFLAATEKDVVLFRHGGDELSAMIFDLDENLLKSTFRKITKAIGELSHHLGLENIEHPKYPGDPRHFGTGVHFSSVEIKAEYADHPQRIFQIADLQLEQEKKGPSHWGTAKMEREIERLLSICADKGVEAVIPEVEALPELLLPLAKACFKKGLSSAGQNLIYLATHYHHD